MFKANIGLPGVQAERLARHRTVCSDGVKRFAPAGAITDGTRTRDPNNDDTRHIRPGTLMGRLTSGGRWANSYFGSLQAAAAASATTFTLTVAEALEVVRRVGASGTLLLFGPPTAAGVVAQQTVTYSAVNTSTGVVTCTALSAAVVAGSLIGANDGTATPISFIGDGWGEYVAPDQSGGNQDIPWSYVPVEAKIDGGQLLPWPADASLKQYIRDRLRTASGLFTFIEQYTG